MAQLLSKYFLKNAGQKNIAVDGSITPVSFDLSHRTFQSFNITSFDIYLEGDANSFSYEDFMGLSSPLTTGIKITVNSLVQVFETDYIKSTRDLFENFDAPSTFIDRQINPKKKSFRATYKIDIGSLVLSNKTNDNITLMVNDDLTSLDYVSFSVKGIVLL